MHHWVPLLNRREFGLERFVPASLSEGMKRKELRRLISHFLKMNAEMTGSSAKVLTQLQVCEYKLYRHLIRIVLAVY